MGIRRLIIISEPSGNASGAKSDFGQKRDVSQGSDLARAVSFFGLLKQFVQQFRRLLEILFFFELGGFLKRLLQWVHLRSEALDQSLSPPPNLCVPTIICGFAKLGQGRLAD